MSLAARITASITIGLAGGVISAASLVAVLEMAETAGIFSDWVSILAPVALAALPDLPLVWGVRAWPLSKRGTPRAAVQAMLGTLTLFTLPAVGLGWVAYHMTRHSQKFLGGMFSWFALLGALLVLAWTALPWLELYLSGRRSNRDAGAAQTTRTPEIRT